MRCAEIAALPEMGAAAADEARPRKLPRLTLQRNVSYWPPMKMPPSTLPITSGQQKGETQFPINPR